MTENNNDRRGFIRNVGLGTAVAGATALSTPALASGKRQVKMLTPWPKRMPGLGWHAEWVAQTITDATEGRLNVKLYNGGEIVPTGKEFMATSKGTADFYVGASVYAGGISPAFAFFGSVPFGLTTLEYYAWFNHGGGKELMNELYGQHNMLAFASSNTGVQMAGWYKKPINSVEDFKGLKIRMGGLGGAVMTKMGATTVSIPGGEIFQALQTNTIDATEFATPYNDIAFGFHKVAKYHYGSGFHEPGSSGDHGVNKDFWNSLSSGDQHLIKAVFDSVAHRGTADYNHNNAMMLRKMEKYGVEVRTFSDEIYETAAKASKEVYAEVRAKDAFTARVIDSYFSYQNDVGHWLNESTIKYVNLRNRYFDGKM